MADLTGNYSMNRRLARESCTPESLAILDQLPTLVALPAPSGRGGFCLRDKDFAGPIFVTSLEATILGHLAQAVGGPVLEIGSATGWSAAHMAQYAEMTCVDPFVETRTGHHGFILSMRERFEDTMVRLGYSSEQVRLLTAYSPQVFESELADALFRMVFVDGSHLDGQPVRDVMAAQGHVVPGGLIVLHDFWMRGVRDAADALRHYGWSITPLATPCVLAVCSRDRDQAWADHSRLVQEHWAKTVTFPPLRLDTTTTHVEISSMSHEGDTLHADSTGIDLP